MAKTRTVTIAGTPFEVPMLPIRLNRIAYPICVDLVNNGLLDRIIEGKGQLSCSAKEMDALSELAYVAACSASPRTTREEFDNWPISPPELVDVFFLIRYQTGGWIAPEDQDDPEAGENDSGEAHEEESPPT